MRPVRFIDLFAGVGGFHIGLERAGNNRRHLQNKKTSQIHKTEPDTEGQNFQGFECVWANEYDKYAASIYRDRFPGTNFNGADIRKIEPEWIPEFDLLVGGFPCQAFSVAGKRLGFDDTRGTLFFEIARILKAKRPRLVLLENVKGLLNHDAGRTFETIISALDELGYNVEWQVLNSKDFGVPQNRERVFIVGHLRGVSSSPIFPLCQGSAILGAENDRQQGNGQGFQSQDISSCIDARYSALRNSGETYIEEGGKLKELTSGVADAQRIYDSEGLARTLKGNSGGQGGKTGLYAFSSSQRKTCIESRWKEGEANTLTQNPTSIKSMNIVVHNLQPRSPDRPSLKYSHGGSGHLTKQDGTTYCLDSGNAQAIEIAPTIRSEHHNTADVHFVPIQGSIRRLTPRECERLQGFPDDWTLNRLVSLQKDMADNQRYKMLGNAVTTNVVTAIGKKILEAGA